LSSICSTKSLNTKELRSIRGKNNNMVKIAKICKSCCNHYFLNCCNLHNFVHFFLMVRNSKWRFFYEKQADLSKIMTLPITNNCKFAKIKKFTNDSKLFKNCKNNQKLNLSHKLRVCKFQMSLLPTQQVVFLLISIL